MREWAAATQRVKDCAAVYECAAVLRNVQENAAAWQLLKNALLPRFAQPNCAEIAVGYAVVAALYTTKFLQSAQLIRVAELPKNAHLPRPAQPNAAEFAVACCCSRVTRSCRKMRSCRVLRNQMLRNYAVDAERTQSSTQTIVIITFLRYNIYMSTDDWRD